MPPTSRVYVYIYIILFIYQICRRATNGQADLSKWNHSKSVASTGGMKLDDLLRLRFEMYIVQSNHCQYV